MINELCRHNYGHRNLGHGRFRPEVLRHRYFYMMGVIGCVHKLNSRMFYTAELGEILFSMTNEGALNRFRTFRAVKLQSVCSYRCERRHFRSDEHVIKGGKSWASNSRGLWGGVVSFLFVSRTKTRVLRTREDLCYHCGPFPACVGIVFNHLLVWMSFSRTSEDIYG